MDPTFENYTCRSLRVLGLGGRIFTVLPSGALWAALCHEIDLWKILGWHVCFWGIEGIAMCLQGSRRADGLGFSVTPSERQRPFRAHFSSGLQVGPRASTLNFTLYTLNLKAKARTSTPKSLNRKPYDARPPTIQLSPT